MQVTGTFTVTLQPLESYVPPAEGAALGRMSIDKEFQGALVAKSQGEMLSARGIVAGSAGYVAIERVTGELAGRRGSFVLQHFGTMAGEASRLILEVVPDSGSDDLVGLSGHMELRREEGIHYYDFTYELPA